MRSGDEVAVVTGAASGIGRAIARRAAAAGMRVGAIDVDEQGLAALRRELGGQCVELPADVTDPDQVDRAAARAFDELGGVGLVSTNAGVASVGTTWETPLPEWHRIFDVNVFGVVHTMRSFVPRLLEQGTPAHIINTASMLGLQCAPLITAYTASKHAVVALSECLAGELAFTGAPIRVSVLCPGRVATELGAGTDDEKMIEEIDDPLNVAIAPEAVAAIVLDAFRSDHGYLFTHDAAPAALRTRIDTVLATAWTPPDTEGG